MGKDLDAEADQRLDQLLFAKKTTPMQEIDLLVGEMKDTKPKTPTSMPKLKRLKTENKLLSKEVRKLKEHFATDKNLRQMKQETVDCFDECKKIL